VTWNCGFIPTGILSIAKVGMALIVTTKQIDELLPSGECNFSHRLLRLLRVSICLSVRAIKSENKKLIRR